MILIYVGSVVLFWHVSHSIALSLSLFMCMLLICNRNDFGINNICLIIVLIPINSTILMQYDIPVYK